MIRILLVYDADGWCWAHQAADIKRFAPAEYEIDIMPSAQYDDAIRSRYDQIVWFSWTESPKFRSKIWTVLAHHGAMFSHTDQSYIAKAAVSRNRNREWADKCLPQFKGILSVNPQLHEFAQKLNPAAYYSPAGVNVHIFQPQWRKTGDKKLVVGWCGQRADYENTKGVKAVLEPLMEKLGGEVEFLINDRTHQNALSREEMCDWYNSIDVFLCTSSTEGTPMPPLEAMACGKPVVTSDVGDLPLLLMTGGGTLCGSYQNYETAGPVVERMAESIRSYARFRESCVIAGMQARTIIVRDRNWDTLARQWLFIVSKMHGKDHFSV